MVNGQWSMVNGQWSMVNGQWSMVNEISWRCKVATIDGVSTPPGRASACRQVCAPMVNRPRQRTR